nr:hypothetical protein [Tanacetum cinerariifolium]
MVGELYTSRPIFLLLIMKTKRKLVPKDVVIGSVEEPRIMGTRGSSLRHVDEGSQAFVVGDSDLGCLAGRVVNHIQTGNINSVDLSSVAKVVDNVNGTFDIHGFSRIDTLLNESQKRGRDNTSICGDAGANDSVPLKRQHMSLDPDPDPGNLCLTTPNTDLIQVDSFQPNVGTSSGVHTSSEINGTHKSYNLHSTKSF